MPRPRAFDVDVALQQAMLAFWHHGYRGTSVRQLCEAMGLRSGSFYATFDSKSALFTRILTRYLHTMQLGEPGAEALHGYLERVIADRDPTGCLLVASSSELHGTTPGFEDFGAVYRQAILEVLRPLVAKAGGSPTVVAQRTNVLATWLLGLDVTTRGGASTRELDEAVDSMGHLVDDWT